MARLFNKSAEKRSLWQRIKDVALTDVGVLVRGLDEGSLEKLEELLIASDFGVTSTMRLVRHVESLSRQGKIKTEQQFLQTVEKEIKAILDGDNSEIYWTDRSQRVLGWIWWYQPNYAELYGLWSSGDFGFDL